MAPAHLGPRKNRTSTAKVGKVDYITNTILGMQRALKKSGIEQGARSLIWMLIHIYQNCLQVDCLMPHNKQSKLL